jgi:hypothetical protein
MHLDRLKQYLRQVEETQLLELLDISSEEIVEMFKERIIQRKKFLEGEVEELPRPQDEDDETEYLDEDLYDEDNLD